jgi:hypothetical protein
MTERTAFGVQITSGVTIGTLTLCYDATHVKTGTSRIVLGKDDPPPICVALDI